MLIIYYKSRNILKKKILLVDDINFVLDLEKALLAQIEEELSFTLDIETASDVKEALRCLESAKYDILITDMNLPDGDGSQIAKSAAKISSGKMTLVALTSLPVAYEEKRELFDLFLTKPTRPQDLKNDLVKLLQL